MNRENKISPFNLVLSPLAEAWLPKGDQYPVCYTVDFSYVRELFPRRFRWLVFSVTLYNLSAVQFEQTKGLLAEYLAEYPPRVVAANWSLSFCGAEAGRDSSNSICLWCRLGYLDDERAARFVAEIKTILAHGDFLPLEGIFTKDPIVVVQQLLSAIRPIYLGLPNRNNYTKYSFDKGSFPFAAAAKLPKPLAKFVSNLSKDPNAPQLLVLTDAYAWASQSPGPYRFRFSAQLAAQFVPRYAAIFAGHKPVKYGVLLRLGLELHDMGFDVQLRIWDFLLSLGFRRVVTGFDKACGFFNPYIPRGEPQKQAAVEFYSELGGRQRAAFEGDVSGSEWGLKLDALAWQENEEEALATVEVLKGVLGIQASPIGFHYSGVLLGSEENIVLRLQNVMRLVKGVVSKDSDPYFYDTPSDASQVEITLK